MFFILTNMPQVVWIPEVSCMLHDLSFAHRLLLSALAPVAAILVRRDI